MVALFAPDNPAPWNISDTTVTLEMSQLSGWLNALASLNRYPISVTLPVSQLSGWLNALASLNRYAICVTLLVSQLSGWLNVDASKNMPPTFCNSVVVNCSG